MALYLGRAYCDAPTPIHGFPVDECNQLSPRFRVVAHLPAGPFDGELPHANTEGSLRKHARTTTGHERFGQTSRSKFRANFCPRSRPPFALPMPTTRCRSRSRRTAIVFALRRVLAWSSQRPVTRKCRSFARHSSLQPGFDLSNHVDNCQLWGTEGVPIAACAGVRAGVFRVLARVAYGACAGRVRALRACVSRLSRAREGLGSGSRIANCQATEAKTRHDLGPVWRKFTPSFDTSGLVILGFSACDL